MQPNKRQWRWFAGLYGISLLALFGLSGLVKLVMSML